MNKIAIVALGTGLALVASAAQADNGGPNSVRIGLYYVHFDTAASNISGPFVPSSLGLNIHVDDIETLYLAYVRTLTPHLDAELTVGYPPLTKTEGRGPATLGSIPYNGKVISSARWFAPSLLLEYVFRDPGARLRPYVGVGVNYTKFFARQSTVAGNAASGGPTSISLPVSVGPVATVGLSYHLADRWHLYASYSISRVNTKLTADTAGLLRTSDIHFWPNAVVVAAGYSF